MKQRADIKFFRSMIGFVVYLSCFVPLWMFNAQLHADEIRLVDLNTIPAGNSGATASSWPRFVGALGGRALFTASQVPSGYILERNLYISDGSPAGTSMLASHAELPFVEPMNGAEFNGKFYFAARSSLYGTELWRTDGTPSGTEIFADISPGPLAHSEPKQFMVAGGVLFFSALREGVNFLFRSDGTPQGTYPLIELGVRSASNEAPWGIVRGNLIFIACPHLSAASCDVYRSDGTETGTMRLTDSPSSSGGYLHAHERMVMLDDKVYFIDSSVQNSVWQSDGTPQGTFRLVNFAGLDGHDFSELVAFNGMLFAAGHVYAHPVLLLLSRADGGYTVLLDGGLSPFQDFTGFNQIGPFLYFRVTSPSADSPRVFRSDGTASGSQPVLDAFAEDFSHALRFGGASYFLSDRGDGRGRELFRTQSGLPQERYALSDIRVGSAPNEASLPTPSQKGEFIIASERLFFSAQDGTHGIEPFVLVAGDFCPEDPEKEEPGVCGCGTSDADLNANGTVDCNDVPAEDITTLALAAPILTQTAKRTLSIGMAPYPGAVYEVNCEASRGKSKRKETFVLSSVQPVMVISKRVKPGVRFTVRYRIVRKDLNQVSQLSPGSAIKIKKLRRKR